MYRLSILEKGIMKQDVVANAEAMGKDINTTGHVSIYGIYFDTGKSVIKPESDAAICHRRSIPDPYLVVGRRPIVARRWVPQEYTCPRFCGNFFYFVSTSFSYLVWQSMGFHRLHFSVPHDFVFDIYLQM